MATETTMNSSPSKNWKKYWRYASSPRNYCPKSSMNVYTITWPNLKPNDNPVIERIDTSYQESYLVCRKSPTLPKCTSIAPLSEVSYYQHDLNEDKQKHGSGDFERPPENTSRDSSLQSRKRPAENRPSISIQYSPTSPKDVLPKVLKLQEKCSTEQYHKTSSACSSSSSSQIRTPSPKEVLPKVRKFPDKCHDTQTRKRPAATVTFCASSAQNTSPQRLRPKILRLQDKYCKERNRNHQTVSADLVNGCHKTGHNQSGGECESHVTEQGFTNQNNLSETKTEGSIYEEELKKSVRPSVSDITLPALSPNITMKLDYDDKGKIKILGKGEYGFVVRAELVIREATHNCVIKFFRQSRSNRKVILDEARILHYLAPTDAVPKVFGLLEVIGQKPAIAQECFADGQDLYKLLDKRQTSSKDWVTICLNSAIALSKIHSKLVVINDIKPDNILADDENNIRFIDMGMATLAKGMTFPPGPDMDECDQLAPECRKGEETTIRSDLFSFGDVLKSIGNEVNVPELTQLSKLLTCAERFQRIDIFQTIRRLKDLEASIEDC